MDNVFRTLLYRSSVDSSLRDAPKPKGPIDIQELPNIDSRLLKGDARTLAKQLPSSVIDLTVTSPPYFDRKNYGVNGQIGFGQSYEEYLSALKEVFRETYRATKETGSLWIVIDTFRKDREVFPLPFDLYSSLRPIGWRLRDIVIWKKERTVPWTQDGVTRRIFEYILVLSKSEKEYRYFPDRLRDHTDLKKWWVRYPERYNPQGKSLEEIWTFDIPTQGSWNKQQVRHFCPLPPQLVSRIVRLTTDPKDLVFDPFAGSGTVLIQAAKESRRFLGFELNAQYARQTQSRLSQFVAPLSSKKQTPSQIGSETFEQQILDLRTLKFGRLLLREALRKTKNGPSIRVFATRTKARPKASHHILCAEYSLVIEAPVSIRSKLQTHLSRAIVHKPFSKFGIEATIKVHARLPPIRKKREKLFRLYGYSLTNSHAFKRAGTWNDPLLASYPLLSPIRLALEIPDE